MSTTHFQPNKETIVGFGLFAGVFLLFIVNAFIVVYSLIDVYGVAKSTTGASAIDDTVLSEAVKALNLENEE